MFSNLAEAKNNILKYIESTNVSISPWWFRKSEEKRDENGHRIREGPKYESAIVNKLFFDIDCLDSEGRTIPSGIESMYRLTDWARQNDYEREYTFTSGGYQIFIGAELDPSIYQGTIYHLKTLLKLDVDPCYSLAQLRRVVGSYNFGRDGKSKRDSYCIDLSEGDIDFLTFEDHRKLSKRYRMGQLEYGKNVYIPPEDIKQNIQLQELDHRSNFSTDNTVDEILYKYGLDYEDICPSIRNIIEQPHVPHGHRPYIIKYLRSVCFITYGDILILLPKLLSAQHNNGTDGSHSVKEGQVHSVYSHSYSFNPSHMKDVGLCPTDCDECDTLLKGLYRAKNRL